MKQRLFFYALLALILFGAIVAMSNANKQAVGITIKNENNGAE